MARTFINAIAPQGPYYYPAPGAITYALTPTDPVNGNMFACSGNYILAFYNSDTVAQSITFHSVADSFGRTGDLAYSVAPGGVGVYKLAQAGWQQPDGNIYFDTTSAKMLILICLDQ